MDTPALRFLALRRARVSRLIADSLGDLAPLTLLRAPAGYGKTTAVAHWAEDLKSAAVDVHWVRSFDAEADAQTLWLSIRDALGAESRRREATQARDDIDRALLALTRPTVLVIDDYQHVSTGDLDTALVRLLDRNELLHIVVLARRFTALDGPLVSSRIGVAVLSSEELALTEEESLQLAELYGVPDRGTVVQLHRRTRGWPLMLRAMLLQLAGGAGSRDSARMLAVFGRQHLGQVAAVGARRALLASVLCPEISIEMLAELIDEPIPVAERTVRELCEHGLMQESFWEHTTRYRCHDGLSGPLGPLARHEFGAEARAVVSRHAADLGRDDPSAAAMQLLDAEDYDGVSRLLARYFLEVLKPDNGVLSRLHRIPDEVLQRHPVIIGAILYSDKPDLVLPNERMEQLYQWLRAAMRSELRDGNYEQNVAAIGLLLTAERMRGDSAEALRISRDTEERIARLPESRVPTYRYTLPLLFGALGRTGLVSGDHLLGERSYWSTVEVADRFGIRYEELRGWIGLAVVTASAGDLRAAERHVARAADLTARSGVEAPQFAGTNIDLANALISIERGDAEEALETLRLERHVLNRIETWPLLLIAEARARELQAGPIAAIELFEHRCREARGGLPSTFHLRCTLSAFSARLSTRIGDYDRASRTLAKLPLQHPDVALADALLRLFTGEPAEALARVDGLVGDEMPPGRHVIALLVEAAARRQRGDAATAVARFAEAAGLMGELGQRLPPAEIPYAVLVELARAARDAGAVDLVEAVEALPVTLRAETVEPLTPAELRTLEALATGATVSRIAEQLFITENTVKFHLRRIYRKLGVVSRAEAVERARQLRLVSAEGDTGR